MCVWYIYVQVALLAGSFFSYRVYHDRLLHHLGYEIQEDFENDTEDYSGGGSLAGAEEAAEERAGVELSGEMNTLRI